jgi:ribose 5-phosphate isomerase B
MKIALAADHGGWELKEQVKALLEERGYETEDLGTHSSASVDYPPYGVACAEAVVGGRAEKGLVFCGSGIGISMAANKVKGARCALVTSVEHAELAAAHNHANLLALGGRLTTPQEAIRYIEAWLATAEDHSERHERRVEELNSL